MTLEAGGREGKGRRRGGGGGGVSALQTDSKQGSFSGSLVSGKIIDSLNYISFFPTKLRGIENGILVGRCGTCAVLPGLPRCETISIRFHFP